MSATKRDRLVREFNLTDEDIRELKYAANRVWNDIGFDSLQATADDKGKCIDTVTIDRATVIELVLDAGRIDEHLRPRRKVTNDILPTDPLSPAGRQFIGNYYLQPKSRELMQLLMKEAFPYSRYGM